MHALSAIITALISPLAFVALIAGGGILLARSRRAWGWSLVGTALGVLLLLSTEPGRDLVIRPLEDRYPAFQAGRPAGVGAVVVLGGGTVRGAPDQGGGTALGAESARRLLYAAGLARELSVPILVSGGTVWERGGEAEALVARGALERLGFPESTIMAEQESRDTWDNARLARPLLARAGVRASVLVTSAYHMPRSMLAFEAAGVAVLPAPTDYRASRQPYDLLSFAPSFRALADSFQALREYAGLLYYRMRR